ncbi:TPA: potassium transporter TrkG [Klebsiella oxytoca]|nr:potassium transporter TrkG [Klebsiella oxytoca]
MLFVVTAATLSATLAGVSLLARTHVRYLARRLALAPDPVLTGPRLLLLTLVFIPPVVFQLHLHGLRLPPLLMQAGLLACAVADAEREWLPDSYTGTLTLLSLYASPLPGYAVWPVMAMALIVCLLSGIVALRCPGLLPGRGDYMLWLALCAWGGLAGCIIILPAFLMAALTLRLTGRDHTPLGPWMGLAGALLVPVTTAAHTTLLHFFHFLFS